MRRVYLDNNATTFMRNETREAFCLRELDGNASSMYNSGRISKYYVEEARAKIAHLISSLPDEIIFTSGATEANNTVLKIAKDIIDKKKKGRILSSSIEHPSIRETLKKMQKNDGFEVIFAPVNSKGVVDVEFCKNVLKEKDVVLTSIMAANNETGIIQPIEEICKIAHEYKSLFHSDATQIIGKEHISFSKLNIDYMSLSSHKIYGPKGIGTLVVKKDAPFSEYITGGHQENGKRAGTYNTNAIHAFGVAASLVEKDMDTEIRRLSSLRDRLEKGIIERIDNIRINSEKSLCLPGTLNVSFRNVEGESILLMLDFEGIEVSTGSACATGSLEPSYVLLASGVPVEDAHGSVRFSFGYYNSDDDVDYVLEKLPPIIKRLRDISTRG